VSRHNKLFSARFIISKNLQGIIESWNAGAERIFGYTAKEAIGQSVGRLGRELSREWNPDGLTIRLSAARPRLTS
jgi:PAS domain S-box-containing protein